MAKQDSTEERKAINYLEGAITALRSEAKSERLGKDATADFLTARALVYIEKAILEIAEDIYESNSNNKRVFKQVARTAIRCRSAVRKLINNIKKKL